MTSTMTRRPSASASRPLAEPRWATPRSPERKTFGPAIAAVAERFGQPLMPWQRMVADVGGELVVDDDTGLVVPAYREVVFTVPRQNGKTTLVLAWECQRAVGWGGPQRLSYSAQSGTDARKKLLLDQKPILKPHYTALGIRRIYEAIGAEGIAWHNGSHLGLLNNTEAGGHGPSLDLGVKDELWKDYDDRRDAALIPSMATKPAAQVLSCSTMGTEESVPWNSLVDQGRLAVETGERAGVAYFEWSADPDADLDDPATWPTFMPAWGYTITARVVSLARTKMTDNGFRRAFGNLQTKADDRVLPLREWDAVCSDTATPVPVAAFALDINPERSAGAITANAPRICELVEHRDGIGWMVGRAAELDAANGHPWWVVDSTGPANSLVPKLEAAGLRVHPASARELIDACGNFLDGVMDRGFAIRRDRKMDDAAAGAAKRSVGDAWAWTRKNASADISPLVAATLGLWAAETLPDEGPSVYEDRGLVTL